MYLLLDNSQQFEIKLQPSALTDTLSKIFKHLRHVPLPFHEWDDPFFRSRQSLEEITNQLVYYGNLVGVEVDRSRCLQQDQEYFNELHRIYEKRYDGSTTWLDYHDHIHRCEKKPPDVWLSLDYREKSGPLEKPFEWRWKENFRTTVEPGDVFIRWAELGKTPYEYWRDSEPNEINRICELAKPWLIMKPRLLVTFDPINFMENKKIDEFNVWWAQYHDRWCKHWKIESWTVTDMYSATLVGRIENFYDLEHHLRQGAKPTKIIQ